MAHAPCQFGLWRYRLDVNGASPPNIIGRDYYVTKNGVYPQEIMGDSLNCLTDNGYGCAGKVLSENAINY